MDTFPVPKRTFLPNLQRAEPLARDHSATNVFKECPRKYFYRMVLGFDRKDNPPWFGFGTAYHKYREVLEKEYVSIGAQMAHVKALEAALNLYPNNPDPIKYKKHKHLTKIRLIESCNVAYAHWEIEKKQRRIEVIGVEEDFAIVDEISGMLITGKADQIIKHNGRVWGRDFKTSSKIGPWYERSHEPNDQVTRYTWALGQLTQTMVQGIYYEVLHQTEKEKPKIINYTLSRNPAQIQKWLEETRLYEQLINVCRDNDTWPMNEKACQYCEYHSCCKTLNEAHLEVQLKDNFKFKPWDSQNRDTDD